MRDPIVDEVRNVRDAYAAEFGYDLRRISADVRRRESESGREYINLPAKDPVPVQPVPKAG